MVETKIWQVDRTERHLENNPMIIEAAEILRQNDVVAFPTETVYGLGGNAKSDEAIQRIYTAKGRPSDNPLIVHVASKDQVDTICTDITPSARKLMNTFWPGPLTLVLPKRGDVSTRVTAGLSTVAVRMPNDPIARALISVANLPIAAPSANLSGKPSPTLAKHVISDLNGKIAGIIDGGSTGVGVESTVLDCTTTPFTILRPGGVSKEQLIEVVGLVSDDPALTRTDQTPKAPGMKYKHYAPMALMYMVPKGKETIQALVNQDKERGQRVGVLTTDENEHSYLNADIVISCGERTQLSTVARRLYQTLREFDDANVDVIYSETFPDEGIGQAIMNRLSKAASGRTIES
ncbi:L-threonylcarbamoyladenylate synthase [Terrilactibacillus laevilacticus]|uniref:Threonylcarbamoyl-AMP synthase n=1 Tax=Terrilactibacillus laevilacticus TaxID=1380157 RepID=A0ABW5PMT9_9BACI|nr:L-threonylcarbamoyladenylate synthase [Terrilactibacillus laevilacticus]